MRHISSTSYTPSGTQHQQRQRISNKKNGFSASSFASKAFVATATAGCSFAAYALLFSSIVTPVKGDLTAANGSSGLYNTETKTDETFGIEYIGFDSYPGMELDDGSGVATKEVKVKSAEIIQKALDAAGLDESGILKGITTTAGETDITMHPKHVHRIGLGSCPVYGCPFFPVDVHYEEEVKAQLEALRKMSSSSDEEENSKTDDDDSAAGSDLILKSSGSDTAATLTLIGYKGGPLEGQINQDRAIALTPYMYWNIGKNNKDTTRPVARLIGAFDGHAKFGEKVSEYVVKTLPALLGNKLVEYEASLDKSKEKDAAEQDHDMGKILHDTFLELDATSPAEPSGGCTASMVLQIGSKLYIANAGDSRSFIAVHVAKKEELPTSIVFGTREDKPHLETERERVEHMGGTVYLPSGFSVTGKGTTRVLYKDPNTGSTSGLAMSRSLGDWDAGEVGCIPDPLIDILDIKEIKQKVLAKLNEDCTEGSEEVEIDASGESSPGTKCITYMEDDIKVFAVSATDGLLDYLPENAIVNHVAKGLYGNNKEDVGEDGQPSATNPLLASEDLIYAAAQGWQDDKGGRYRDDIAIAVTDLSLE